MNIRMPFREATGGFAEPERRTVGGRAGARWEVGGPKTSRSGGEAVITCLWSYTSGGGIAIRQGFLRVANVFGSALTANY